MSSLRITGAIDRHDPDPAAPQDPCRAHIGMLVASWQDADRGGERTAAILKHATGRGTGDALWGAHVLVLSWIGDPPPVEIALAVYDIVLDGGPGRRKLDCQWTAQPRTDAQPSYRRGI